MPTRTLFSALCALALAVPVIAPNPVSGQELWGRGIQPGQLSLTTGGLFESAADRLTPGGGRAPLAGRWVTGDAASLFPGSDILRESLSAASGLSGWTGTAGAVRAEVQVSRITFPVELRIGVLDRLTIGGRVISRKDRVESELRVAPSDGIDLGVTPATGRFADVDAFLTALDDAVATLPTDGPWSLFADRMRDAYLSSALFPVTGSEVAEALQLRLTELDDALVAAGSAPLSLEAPFAETPLDTEGFSRILTAGDGDYRYQPLGTPSLSWNPGDTEVWANWDLFRDGGLSTIEGRGLAVWAGARIPTGTPENPNLHFDAGSGDGQLDLLGGADAWLRRPQWGVSGGIDFAWAAGATERGFRIIDPSYPFSPAVWFATADWTPGPELRFRLFPSLSPATGLWFDAGYVLDWRGDGTFEFGDLAANVPDPGTLADQSGSVRHDVTFGLRYRIPDLAEGRVEVWSRWTRTVTGTGGNVPAWTTLDLGARIWRTLW